MVPPSVVYIPFPFPFPHSDTEKRTPKIKRECSSAHPFGGLMCKRLCCDVVVRLLLVEKCVGERRIDFFCAAVATPYVSEVILLPPPFFFESNV